MKVDDRRCLFLIAITSPPPPWHIRSWGMRDEPPRDPRRAGERAYSKFAPRMRERKDPS